MDSLSLLEPGDLPNPGIEPRSPTLQVDSLPAEPQGKTLNECIHKQLCIFVYKVDLFCLQTFVISLPMVEVGFLDLCDLEILIMLRGQCHRSRFWALEILIMLRDQCHRRRFFFHLSSSLCSYICMLLDMDVVNLRIILELSPLL